MAEIQAAVDKDSVSNKNRWKAMMDETDKSFLRDRSGETTVTSSSTISTTTATASTTHDAFTEVMRSQKKLVDEPTFQAAAFLINDHRGVGNAIKVTTKLNDDEPTTGSSGSSSTPSTGTTFTDWRAKFRQTFYQRQQEQQLLRRAYESSKKTPNQLTIISGGAGLGKTRLAKTLQPLVMDQQDKGYFVLGKFDQLQRAAPYTAFVHAFTDFTKQVMHRGTVEMTQIQTAIAQALDTDTSVLTGVIPALEQILVEGQQQQQELLQQAGPQSMGGGALARFVFSFRMFIRSICSPDRPLVLVLDDLQYADLCSIDLFYSIASDPRIHGLVLVATCDDSHVQPGSYLATKLRDLEDRTDSKIFNLVLSNYTPDDVDHVLANVLVMDPTERRVLTEMAYRETKGNALYLIEYLKWIQDKEILEWDRDLGRWTVDQEEAKTMFWTEGCESKDFLTRSLTELPSQYQEVLKVSACLGPTINEKLLDHVLSLNELPEILEDLGERGFLWKPCGASRYEFDHDIVQDAAYQLIDKSDRELFHLEIGRRTWRKLSSDDLDNYLFVVLSQMMIGRNLIKRDQEQVAVATLCLHAGRKAAKASTFRTAAIYLDFGLALMDDKHWRSNYDLMLALHNASAEMEMCRANLDRMNVVLDEIFRHSRVSKDKYQAFNTKIYALASQGRQHEAIDLGITLLDELGEPVKRDGCRFIRVMSEYRTVSKLLRNKTDEQLLRMGSITDQSKLHALQIINVMMLPTILERPDLAPFVILKLMKITLEHGLSVFASSAFAVYGMFCISAGGQAQEAKRFADLAIILLERNKAIEYLPRVHCAVYGCINVWLNPVIDSLEYLLEVNRIGALTGDFEFAGLCANQYCFNAFDAGIPLDEILIRWQGFYEVLSMNKQNSMIQMAMPSIHSIRLYMGLADDDSTVFAFDYDDGLESAEKRGELSTVTGIKFCRMTMNYLFGNFDMAFRYRATLKDIMSMAPTIERSSCSLFLGMVSIEMARRNVEVRQNVQTAKKCRDYLRRWSRSCPQNFADKVFLIEAELASLGKKREVAFEKYICAIGMAKNSNFTHLVGLANERLGWHFHRLGDISRARQHWKDSQVWYSKWKAKGLVDRLDVILRKYTEGIETTTCQ